MEANHVSFSSLQINTASDAVIIVIVIVISIRDEDPDPLDSDTLKLNIRNNS